MTEVFQLRHNFDPPATSPERRRRVKARRFTRDNLINMPEPIVLEDPPSPAFRRVRSDAERTRSRLSSQPPNLFLASYAPLKYRRYLPKSAGADVAR